MAKRAASRGKGIKGGKPQAEGSGEYRASDIDSMEHLAMDKANKCISAIENAIAVWELAKDRPVEMDPEIGKMRRFYKELTGWEKRMLATMGKHGEIESRVARLKEFVGICYAYT